jgi:HD-GYP domain-containing protein (c-di-GMP phosphodiesterase class II)
MRFARRTFVWSFVPVAALLLGSLWAVERLVISSVRDELRTSLRRHQAALAQLQLTNEQQSARSLRVLSENASLKAGLQLLLAERNHADARLTVEDQLKELCGSAGFDFLLVSDMSGNPLAGAIRSGASLSAVDTKKFQPPQRGFFVDGEIAYQVTSIPVDQGDENIAVLSVGERFDFAAFKAPAVLLRNATVLKSSLSGVEAKAIEAGLQGCRPDGDCEVRLHGQTYVSTATTGAQFGNGFTIRSFENLDTAIAPVQSVLQSLFWISGSGALIAAMILTAISSRSIVKPLEKVVRKLRESEKTGVLSRFDSNPNTVQEIGELTSSFNRAVTAILEGQESLHKAYVECVGSLASALDARDCYTAGHSHRVSEFSCAVAEEMNLDPKDVEELRIGALLHDIGKIGIPDSVLQKPGRLTDEEFSLIQKHPTIGRRILEGVHGFAPYLDTVELHHENWDGSGYPRGLRGEETPRAARIVHVADAYDAMTSDRPYRRGRTSEDAVRVLEENAGTQFDPTIVAVFTELARAGTIKPERLLLETRSLIRLAAALEQESAPAPASQLP